MVPGTYADYVEELQRRSRETGGSRRSGAQRGAEDAAAAAAAHAERRRRSNDLTKARRALKDLEERMARIAQERTTILGAINGTPVAPDPTLYSRLARIDDQVAADEHEWLELTTKIESLAD